MPVIRLAAFASLVLLAGCRVDAIAPVDLSTIHKAATTGEPIEVTARLLLTFTSPRWCEDLGAGLVTALGGAGLNMVPVSCGQEPVGTNWHGELRMPIRLDAAAHDKTLEGGDVAASLSVVSGVENTDSVVLVARLDAQRLKSARERLLEIPAVQDNDDAQVFDLSISFLLKNDFAQTASLTVDAMTAEIDPKLAIPPGGVRTIALSPLGVAKLLEDRPIQVFAVKFHNE
jgi:hypothetical protein